MSTDHLRLADPLERALTKIATWKMVEAGTTPTLLPLEAFRAIWWDANSMGGQSKVAADMLKTIRLEDQRYIAELAVEETPRPKENKAPWCPEGEHGLHALENAVGPDIFPAVFGFINKRRLARSKSAMLSKEKLLAERAQCQYCQESKSPGLSTPGIYYAPPGAGKTTAQNRELLVGLDTDWIGKGVTWRELSPMLNLGIPILTNQREGFLGSSFKVIGGYNHHLRIGPRRKPFVSYSAVEAMVRAQPKNFLFFKMRENEYFTDNVLKFQIVHILQQMIAEYSINRVDRCF